MCLETCRRKSNSRSDEKRQVAVLDPESCEFRRVQLKNLRSMLAPEWQVYQTANGMVGSDFEEIEIPKYQRTFDVYAPTDDAKQYSNEKDSWPSSTSTKTTHSIVTRKTQDTRGKSLVARLKYAKLGPVANFQRAVSKKHRVLYIGTIKPSYY